MKTLTASKERRLKKEVSSKEKERAVSERLDETERDLASQEKESS